MPSPCASEHSMSSALTGVALRLLDLTFEPASVCCGERFDLVVESLSDQISDYASALLGGLPQPPFEPPELPQLPSAVTRRAQFELREAVEGGRLPGSTRSVRACLLGIEQASDDLAAVAACDPARFAPSLGGCIRALSRLARTIDTYLQARVRLEPALALAEHPSVDAADAATRSERALLRCLDRTGDERDLR